MTTNYTGSDATIEIVTMLFVAFILGFLTRWIWDKFHNCIEEYQEFVIKDNKTSSNKDVIHETVFRQRTDDLKVIEGIGPKIESILKNAQINTWKDLSQMNEESIRGILKEAGDNFSFHNPKTWPDQAKLAHQGKWEELEEFQYFLNGRK